MSAADLEGVLIPSGAHELLGGFYRAAGPGPRPAVVLLHGIPGIEKNLDLAYALRDAGWHCLYFHYRGSWGSPGRYQIATLIDDALAAVRWVRARGDVDRERVFLVGHSLGGYTALAAFAADPVLAGAVALAPLVDPGTQPIDEATAASFAAMLHGTAGPELLNQWRALPSLTRWAELLVDRPVLLVTADEDSFFRAAHHQPLVDAVPSITWQRFAANHGFALCRPALVATVVTWLTTR